MRTLHVVVALLLASIVVQVLEAGFVWQFRDRRARDYRHATSPASGRQARTRSVPQPAPQRTPRTTQQAAPRASVPIVPNHMSPETKLVRLIKQNQMMYVSESWGTDAWQCFTDRDYQAFRANNETGRMVAGLRKDAEFLALIDEIRKLSPGRQHQLLARAARTYKPTWAQLGGISRAGQTNAGQRAESEIAQSIVSLVRQLLRQK